MEILDADGEVLADSNGNKAIRDIVQLVEYDSFAQKGERELAMAVLGELPDQFVDYMVMKENEREKIYQPEMQPFDDPNDNAADTARDGEVNNNTFAPPSGPVPEEFKSGPAGQEDAMIQMASINTGRNEIQENFNTGRSNQPLNNNVNGVNLMPLKQKGQPQHQDDVDDKLNGTGQRLI